MAYLFMPKTDVGDPDYAHEVSTVVMPQYEVPVTETPGIRAEDRPAMREMVEKGHLDMEVLAAMDRTDCRGHVYPDERLREMDRRTKASYRLPM